MKRDRKKEQQNHIFTGTRSAERTRADQEEEYREDHQNGRGEGQQVDRGYLQLERGLLFVAFSGCGTFLH